MKVLLFSKIQKDLTKEHYFYPSEEKEPFDKLCKIFTRYEKFKKQLIANFENLNEDCDFSIKKHNQ